MKNNKLAEDEIKQILVTEQTLNWKASYKKQFLYIYIYICIKKCVISVVTSKSLLFIQSLLSMGLDWAKDCELRQQNCRLVFSLLHAEILNFGIICLIAGKTPFILSTAETCELVPFVNSQISEIPKFSHLPCSAIHVMLFSAWDAKILIHATCCTSSQ